MSHIFKSSSNRSDIVKSKNTPAPGRYDVNMKLFKNHGSSAKFLKLETQRIFDYN